MVFTIYGRGGHLGHVTWISRLNLKCHYPRRLHIKFQLDRPSGFRDEIFEIVDDDDDGRTTTTTDGRRTDDGRTPAHGHPISSPCEPSAQVS